MLTNWGDLDPSFTVLKECEFKSGNTWFATSTRTVILDSVKATIDAPTYFYFAYPKELRMASSNVFLKDTGKSAFHIVALNDSVIDILAHKTWIVEGKTPFALENKEQWADQGFFNVTDDNNDNIANQNRIINVDLHVTKSFYASGKSRFHKQLSNNVVKSVLFENTRNSPCSDPCWMLHMSLSFQLQ